MGDMIGLSVAFLLLVGAIAWLVHHQRALRQRAEMMREAIRNHDFMFRLPTGGLLPGERAMQETLNQLGSIIREQVNENEVEAWERLTRVLTHEIMNATAPVTSISQSLLKRDDVKGTPLEDGIRAIHTTSTHLNSFVASYRKLSQLQKPQPEELCLAKVVSDVAQLYPELSWQLLVAEDCIVRADPTMLRQVLINLTKNAIEADAKRMGIALGAEETEQKLQFCVSNDGHRIPTEERSSIFIPFFTTKRTGSGIGLSLCRRMMVQQGGWLELADHADSTYQTTFVIQLPKP